MQTGEEFRYGNKGLLLVINHSVKFITTGAVKDAIQNQLVGGINAYQGNDSWLVSADELATLGLK